VTPETIKMIRDEVARGRKAHPKWPTDLTDQFSIMAEEADEAAKAAVDFKFHDGTLSQFRTEVVHTAAMCVRILENF